MQSTIRRLWPGQTKSCGNSEETYKRSDSNQQKNLSSQRVSESSIQQASDLRKRTRTETDRENGSQ